MALEYTLLATNVYSDWPSVTRTGRDFRLSDSIGVARASRFQACPQSSCPHRYNFTHSERANAPGGRGMCLEWNVLVVSALTKPPVPKPQGW